MSIKIQINSLQALERLIGGDTELELEIRNNIVQEFAKKHLKALTGGVLERAAGDINRAILNELNSKFGKYNPSNIYYGYKFELNKDIKDAISQVIADEINSKLRDQVVECIQSIDIESRIRTEVDRCITVAIKDEVNNQIKDKIKRLMD